MHVETRQRTSVHMRSSCSTIAAEGGTSPHYKAAAVAASTAPAMAVQCSCVLCANRSKPRLLHTLRGSRTGYNASSSSEARMPAISGAGDVRPPPRWRLAARRRLRLNPRPLSAFGLSVVAPAATAAPAWIQTAPQSPLARLQPWRGLCCSLGSWRWPWPPQVSLSGPGRRWTAWQPPRVLLQRRAAGCPWALGRPNAYTGRTPG